MTANHSPNTDLLFEHFATLATAPDGIARLRELILQLAVQGKLGTQDAGDEPASKLSSKILEEKKRLIKKGDILKSRALPEIESEEIPFHIPKNWVWLRLEDVGHSCGQKEPDKIFTYIDVTAINKERGLIGDEVNVLQPNEAPSRARKLVKNGTVIYSTVRPYLLNIAIVDKDFNPEPIVSTAFAVLHPFEGIFNRYLFYYLRSKPFVEYVESQMTGMAYPAINDQKFHMGLIPVPPTAEQHRIVAKVDRLMSLCDELEARQRQERAGCLKLGTASLAGLQNAESPEEFGRQWAQVCNAFDLILDCPENVAELRQTILNLAVHGRLLQQMPGDEPAEKLLERIRKEKERLVKEGEIKREKPLEPVLDDEIPFAIPDTWNWVRINDAAKIVEYGTSEKAMPSTTAYGKNSVPVFRMNNIQNGKVIHENLKYLPNSMEELPRLYLQNNDILINRTNSYELVGKAGIFKGEDDKFTFASYLIRISFFPQLVDPDFVNITLNASYFRTSQIEPQVTQQCGQANFSGSKIKNALIPLPPLAEQHRIVAKVDALMALCDALESRLKERARVQGKMAGAVVKQVAG